MKKTTQIIDLNPSGSPAVRKEHHHVLDAPDSYYAYYNEYHNRRMQCTTHYHEYMELILISSGSLHINIKYKTFTCTPGNIILLAENTIHSAWCDSADNACFHVLQVKPLFFANTAVKSINALHYTAFINYMKVNQYAILHDPETFHPLVDLVVKLIQEIEGGMLGYDVATRSYIYLIFTYLMRNMFANQEKINDYIYNFKKIEKAIVFIHDNYMKDINMAMAANKVNLTYNYFSWLFIKITSHTFSEYLNLTRIQEFERILLNGRKSISTAALEAGFTNVTHFNRVYKKYRKVSPRQYIRNFDSVLSE
ncbi:MAG TPA: hypothetical protein DD727_02665 [Clostridiales bacterium]|nr:hypothetical protein [Clostridiales bacterium]